MLHIVFMAQGDESSDVGNRSPAHVKAAITVGATDINDVLDTYSNFGSAVDIFAPGTDVISTNIE